MIASKPVYIASMKSVPYYVVDSIQTLHKDFIWNGKKPKIKHTILISDYTKGGLKDTDINCKLCSLKFSWIARIVTQIHATQDGGISLIERVFGHAKSHIL